MNADQQAPPDFGTHTWHTTTDRSGTTTWVCHCGDHHPGGPAWAHTEEQR